MHKFVTNQAAFLKRKAATCITLTNCTWRKS